MRSEISTRVDYTDTVNILYGVEKRIGVMKLDGVYV